MAWVLVVPISSVWPSAGAVTAMREPSVPPAPGRLSTTTCWPKNSTVFWATTRASMSVAPPTGNGTIMRTARLG